MTPRFQFQLRLVPERGALLRALALVERRGRALGRDHLLLRRERGGHEEHRGAHEDLFCRR